MRELRHRRDQVLGELKDEVSTQQRCFPDPTDPPVFVQLASEFTLGITDRGRGQEERSKGRKALLTANGH